MFATRNHNENAIYEQQTAAAGKPLNQGVKGLAPKTPPNKASKTPFKVSLNDENATFGQGKTGGKGKEGGLFGDGKGGKTERSAFVTPAGPRTRAPLGAKTTNAKANLLRTPAPPSAQADKPSTTTKPTSPRLRRAKVKIHTATADPLDNGSEEREIEYMPPREVPLPDYPEDWPHDRTYPQFEGKNLTRGWSEEFRDKTGDKGSDEEYSDFEEKVRKAEEGREKRGAADKAKANAGVVRQPATLKSKGAATALSSVPKQRTTPSFAAPTAAAKARLPSAPLGKKSTATGTAQGNTRYTSARVASNTTLGYSKGRQVSATARKPLSSIHEKPSVSGESAKKAEPTKMPFAGGATLDELLGLQSLSLEVEGGEDELSGGLAAVKMHEEDELEDFQLDTMEL